MLKMSDAGDEAVPLATSAADSSSISSCDRVSVDSADDERMIVGSSVGSHASGSSEMRCRAAKPASPRMPTASSITLADCVRASSEEPKATVPLLGASRTQSSAGLAGSARE